MSVNVQKGHVLTYANLLFISVSQGHVVMGTQAVSVYQQVIEKTKGLSIRSQELFNGIEKKLGVKDKDGVSCLSSPPPQHCCITAVCINLLKWAH